MKRVRYATFKCFNVECSGYGYGVLPVQPYHDLSDLFGRPWNIGKKSMKSLEKDRRSMSLN